MGRPRELLWLGDTIDARRALEIGLANEVVPRAKPEARCLALVERLLTVPRTSMVHIERLSNLACQTDVAGFRQAYVPAQHEGLASPEQAAKAK